MRFLMLYRPDPSKATPPTAEHMATMGKYMEEMMHAGVLIDTGGLLPTAMGARVVRSGTELTASDGALPDMKQPVCGYAICQYATKEEAVAGAKQFLSLAGEGWSEVLPLMDAPPQPSA